jgi:chaperonin GroES
MIPFGNNVIIRPKTAMEKTTAGLYLPPSATKEGPLEGTVVAVSKTKNLGPEDFKIGDGVLFNKHNGRAFKDGDQEFFLIDMEDIIGVCVDI